MKTKHIVFVIIVFAIQAWGCKETTIPRPRAYFRIQLPERKFVELPDSFPYKFQVPEDVVIERDYENNSKANWINLNYPKLNAKIHISYYKIHSNLQKLLDDTYALTYKHTVKADAIEELAINYPDKKVFGTFYDIEGEAASQLQFFVTDSVENYFRAALYFHCKVNRDSLNPVIEYIKADMVKIYETFKWNETYKN
jgi:gliding motility-associated lipoprotein GldD